MIDGRGGSVSRILVLRGGGDRQTLTLRRSDESRYVNIFGNFLLIVVVSVQVFMLTLLFGMLFLSSTLSSSISAK
jgi:hypothetical protein